MKMQKMNWIGIGAGILLVFIDLLFFLKEYDMFVFLLGISIGVAVLPFVISLTIENNRQKQINEMFLEFTRNLAESVTTGTPISKSIVNLSKKEYGALKPHVQKLANQISLGIPVNQALEIFGYDINNPTISRAIGLIREAERAGGEIDYILDSVAKSISEIEKLKNERKSAIYSLIVQGYIIFFIFIGIMIVMEFKIIPLATGTGGFVGFGDIGSIGNIAEDQVKSVPVSPQNFANPMLFLIITQGICTGLVIGKLAEGKIQSGVKHSFIMALCALIIVTGARIFLS
jgi:flagellar protein FlaJ